MDVDAPALTLFRDAVSFAGRRSDEQMDDPVSDDHVDQVRDTCNNRNGWRGRFALALLAVLIVLGYVAIFLAFDFWYRGS